MTCTFVLQWTTTTADFIVADTCNIVADANITQRVYATGSSDEIAQLEKLLQLPSRIASLQNGWI
jgi:hypothetical protein